MKNQCICPKCDGRTFYAVEMTHMPYYPDKNKVMPLTLATFTGVLRLPEVTRSGRHSAGIEAWVCAGCAYTEFYASDLEVLAAMAEQGEGTVRKIDVTAPDHGPHR